MPDVVRINEVFLCVRLVSFEHAMCAVSSEGFFPIFQQPVGESKGGLGAALIKGMDAESC